MDFGQITQGLRTDVMQQAAQQGINVSQLMESGVSFADIMKMIFSEQQSMAVMPAVPDGENISGIIMNAQNAGNMPLMENMQSADNIFLMQNIRFADDMTFPDAENIVLNNAENDAESQLSETETVTDETEQPVENKLDSKADSNAEIKPEQPVENKADIKADNNAEIKPEQPVENKADIKAESNAEIKPEQPVENKTDSKAEIKPEQPVENKTENQPEVKPQQSAEHKKLNITDIQKKVNPVKKDNAGSDTINNTNNTNNINTNINNKSDKPYSENTAGTKNGKTTADVQNIQNIQSFRTVSNLNDIDVFSTVFSQTADSSQQSAFTGTPVPEKLLSLINNAPELMTAYQNLSAENPVSKNNFVADMLSALSEMPHDKDSFDFSEDVLKVDPLQLAGLLDFISTGTGIPVVSDITDNAVFKNMQSMDSIGKISYADIFNPEEMIKSGEMEILSYVPSESKSQNNSSQENPMKNNEETIGFARTMKNVRDTVKPLFSDNDDSEDSIRNSDVQHLTMTDLETTAHKIDISFDRAYAELKMNTSEYGTPDEQVFKGIAENLQKGKSEFTVKLRPEGLGEIIVKLVSDESGKTVLSMLASSEKTAELLNRDLASLQSTLNLHNVEIENNRVRTLETVTAADTPFSQYDERRQDEGRQQNRYRELRGKIKNVSVGSASFDEASEPIAAVEPDSALNITI